MCTSVDIVWKSRTENFGFEAELRASRNSCVISCIQFLAKKIFQLAAKALYTDGC